ncbi:response regulator [Flavihumibacter petaseus]|nr:response regulator [Flavihumibacter petaseus]
MNRSFKVFLGEDDLDDQDFFKEAFESLDHDYEVSCFTNGKVLLEYLQRLDDSQLPSLIVLDYNLPLMNGSEILKMLAETNRYHKIPKLIWSTSSSPAFRKSCLENGAADYLVKPSDVDGLVRIGKKMKEYISH